MHDLKVGQECGKAVEDLKVELHASEGVAVKLDAELTSVYQALHFVEAGNKEWKARFENQQKLTKEEKKGKRKVIAGLGLAIGIIILETIALAGGG